MTQSGGDLVTACLVQWEPNRPLASGRRAKQRRKTDVTLERAITEVGGLPADPDVLKAMFYKLHGGSNHAANTAWHRAVEVMRLELVENKLDDPM